MERQSTGCRHCDRGESVVIVHGFRCHRAFNPCDSARDYVDCTAEAPSERKGSQ